MSMQSISYCMIVFVLFAGNIMTTTADTTATTTAATTAATGSFERQGVTVVETIGGGGV